MYLYPIWNFLYQNLNLFYQISIQFQYFSAFSVLVNVFDLSVDISLFVTTSTKITSLTIIMLIVLLLYRKDKHNI